jgi:hypothetical protein
MVSFVLPLLLAPLFFKDSCAEPEQSVKEEAEKNLVRRVNCGKRLIKGDR